MKLSNRKSLVAAAVFVAATSSGVAQAVDLSATTSARISQQALALMDVVPAHSGGIRARLGVEYAVSDLLIVTFTGEPELVTDSLPTTISAEANADLKGITFSLISADPHELVYRVTDITDSTGPGAGTTEGVRIDIQSLGEQPLEFSADSMSLNSAVRANIRTETPGGLELEPHYSDLGVAILSVAPSEFEVTIVNEFESVIDVASEPARSRFVERDARGPAGIVGSGHTVNDFMRITLRDIATGTVNQFSATHESTTYIIKGDFSWLVDADPDTEELELVSDEIFRVSGGFNVFNASDMEVTNESVTFGLDELGTFYFAIDVSENGNEPLNTTNFTISVETEYSDDGLLLDGIGGTIGDGSQTNQYIVTTDMAIGEWQMTGSQIGVSYMPYRDDISQIINLTNTSGQAGEVYVTAYPEDGGKPIELGGVALAGANSVITLSGDIIDALTDKTGINHRTSENTVRYAFEIVSNLPAGTVEVYSAYNVDGTGARLVINDSNGSSAAPPIHIR